MPFDGLVGTRSLAATLKELGITPIDMAALHAHKEAEIKKHPASLFWKHRTLFIQIANVSMMAVLAAFANVVIIACRGTIPGVWDWAMLAVPFVTMCKIEMTTARGPAQWKDELTLNFAKLPPAIRDVAYRVKRADSRVAFIVGTLFQESTVLDPYLVARKYDWTTGETELVCLGIWDGDRIIAIAE